MCRSEFAGGSLPCAGVSLGQRGQARRARGSVRSRAALLLPSSRQPGSDNDPGRTVCLFVRTALKGKPAVGACNAEASGRNSVPSRCGPAATLLAGLYQKLRAVGEAGPRGADSVFGA